jgi:hypothetical protein
VRVINTADEPVPVSVANLPAVQTVNVNNFPAVQPVNGTVNVGNLPAVQQVQIANDTPLLVQEVRQPFQFHYAERKEANVIFGCRPLDLPPGEDFVLESVTASKDELQDADLDLLYLELKIKSTDDFFTSARLRVDLPLTTAPFGTGGEVNDQRASLQTQILVRPEAAFEAAALGDVWRVEVCIGRDQDVDGLEHGVVMLLDGTRI